MSYFNQKVAIVTGGASGIGKSICLYLSANNSKVILADKNAEAMKETEREIIDAGGFVRVHQLDVSEPTQINKLITQVKNDFGQIDFLFNNAGISANGEFIDTPIELWRKIIDVNVWGVIYGCQAVYPIMQEQGFGHIVNTASLAGLIPGGLTSAYSTSKHAVVGFTQTLRSEAKQYGIRVSALCPGYIRTNIQKTTPNLSDYLNHPKNIEMNANKKFKTADECVEQMMRQIKRNKAIIISPIGHKIYWILHRVFPGFISNMFQIIIRKMKENARQ